MLPIRKDSEYIIRQSIHAVKPDAAVRRALHGKTFGNGKVLLVAVGKAAWQMADVAGKELGGKLTQGIVITKYDHSQGPIPGVTIYEAGHPVPDENSFRATSAVLEMTRGLCKDDTVLLLLSGGGSALFEAPLVASALLTDLTQQLLASGASIVEMNTIRKRFSGVKGGRFAEHCAPAHVFAIVLSDIISDPLDMIASGPAYPDSSTAQDAVSLAEKYNLQLTESMRTLLSKETPKTLNNVETIVTGSVSELCRAAADAAAERGYCPYILTDSLDCEASEAGSFLGALARYHQNTAQSIALIAGGETVVHLQGKGLGGRNQELALSAAAGISGLADTAVFSVGSDGTDGPTDAAGGYADGQTMSALKAKGIDIHDMLRNNDAYHALEACDGLLFTGPTGTNVNDVSVLLIKR